jgi:hypothetical protein
MDDNMAKVISTVSIWGAVACICIFGIFAKSWGMTTLPFAAGIVVTLGIAAAIATMAIWRERKSDSEQTT